MATLRQVQKQMTRQVLLATALKAFESKGYAATTVDEIARAAGTTRTTFYMHFRSRSELMGALLEEVSNRLDGDDQSSGSLRRAARNADQAEIAALLGRLSELWTEIQPYVQAAHEAAALDPEIRAVVDDWIETAVDAIEAGLNDAGRFAVETRRIRAVLAFSQLEWLSRRWMRHGWDIDRDLTLELLAESWMDLLSESGQDPSAAS